MTRGALAGVSVALLAAITACGAPGALSPTGAVSSPIATARPTPALVDPASATLDLRLTFEPGVSPLGDPTETVKLTTTTNAPTALEYYPVVTVDGKPFFDGCDGGLPDRACILEHGTDVASVTYKQAAPKGLYHATVLVPSYSVTDGGYAQDHAYLDWVGSLGARLAGNPLAVRDPDHPAILNLRQEITVQH